MKHNTKDEILDEIKPLTIDLQEAFDNGAAFLGNSSFVPSEESFNVFLDDTEDDMGFGVKVV